MEPTVDSLVVESGPVTGDHRRLHYSRLSLVTAISADGVELVTFTDEEGELRRR